MAGTIHPMRSRLTLMVAAALVAAGGRAARAEDRWLGRDKGLHFAASAAIAAAGYAASSPWIERPAGRAAVGASLALSAGVAKEIWDAREGGGDPSWKDLAWDAIGTAVGVGVALLVDRAAR
jgi:putative lipoprotein